MTTLKITVVRSTIRRKPAERKTIRALGLTRLHQSVKHAESPQIRGMLHKVRHLVRVEEEPGS